MTYPEGFTEHDGNGCPVEPTQYIEGLVRTIDGLGSTGVMQARYHIWDIPSKDPHGQIVAYRRAERGESAKINLSQRILE